MHGGVKCFGAHSGQKRHLLTILHFIAAFSYGFYLLAPKRPLPRKTLHFASQYAAYWAAICWVLDGKMQGFGLLFRGCCAAKGGGEQNDNILVFAQFLYKQFIYYSLATG